MCIYNYTKTSTMVTPRLGALGDYVVSFSLTEFLSYPYFQLSYN